MRSSDFSIFHIVGFKNIAYDSDFVSIGVRNQWAKDLSYQEYHYSELSPCKF